jgi:hypothetical protein
MHSGRVALGYDGHWKHDDCLYFLAVVDDSLDGLEDGNSRIDLRRSDQSYFHLGDYSRNALNDTNAAGGNVQGIHGRSVCIISTMARDEKNERPVMAFEAFIFTGRCRPGTSGDQIKPGLPAPTYLSLVSRSYCFTGKVTIKVDPWPGVLWTVIWPACRSTILRAIARPIPAPS